MQNQIDDELRQDLETGGTMPPTYMHSEASGTMHTASLVCTGPRQETLEETENGIHHPNRDPQAGAAEPGIKYLPDKSDNRKAQGKPHNPHPTKEAP